jgi:hypothetical protein
MIDELRMVPRQEIKTPLFRLESQSLNPHGIIFILIGFKVYHRSIFYLSTPYRLTIALDDSLQTQVCHY